MHLRYICTMSKSGFFAVFLGIALLLTGCKPVDIRTSAAVQAMQAPDAEQRGKTLLAAMAAAHYADKWLDHPTSEIEMSDTYFGFFRLFAPFPGSEAVFHLRYINATYDGTMTLANGKQKGRVWGISDWKTWRRRPGKEKTWKKKKNIWFWVPTYQYFLMFPLKIQEATCVRHAGTQTIQGKPHEVVFASWNSPEPQKDMDQYMIYLDPESKLIRYIWYTVRGQGKPFHAGLIMQGQQEIGGIVLPEKMLVIGPKVDFEDPQKGHLMQVRGVQFGVERPVPPQD